MVWKSDNDGDEPEIGTTRVRQGVTGHNVRYVLIFGLLGVILAFAVLLVAYGADF